MRSWRHGHGHGHRAPRLKRSRAGTFRSLRVRNYRLYWLSQLGSQLGQWMRLIALSWLVLTTLHGNGTEVGALAAAQYAPTLLFSAWAGALADRRSPIGLIKVTQITMIVVDVALVTLTAMHVIQIWSVFVLTTAAGFTSAFELPSRQALVGELVGLDLLPNAVALNSTGLNATRVIGPAIAGGIIDLGGPAACFGADTFARISALIGIYAIDKSRLHGRDRVPRGKRQVRDGLEYALAVPVLRSTLIAMLIVGTMSMNFTVIVPLLAHSDTSSAGTFGLFSAAMGAGSLLGAVLAARRTEPTMRHLAVATLGLAVGMVGVGLAPVWPVALAALAFTGVFVITFLATTNSLLQLRSKPDMRGRVTSLYIVLLVGTSPIGGPAIGWIAMRFGVSTALFVGAVGAGLGLLTLALTAPAELFRTEVRSREPTASSTSFPARTSLDAVALLSATGGPTDTSMP